MAGTVAFGISVGGYAGVIRALPKIVKLGDGRAAIPVFKGYLLVDQKGDLKARKCELCANAPYHWGPAGGGPQGQQACVEVCPVGAIQFTAKVPAQQGDAGYKVNLRDAAWAGLGYPID